MKTAFRKTAYFPSRTEMIPQEEGSWDLLKILMCRAWGVEKLFNDHCVWERIRDGSTIQADGYLYCVYDEFDAQPFELFSGDLLILDSDAEPQG